MLRIEFSPEERAQFQREQLTEDRAWARVKARAAADPFQVYRCTCGNEEKALYVAWNGLDCACGLRLEGVAERVVVGA